jgi:hypothetical protein
MGWDAGDLEGRRLREEPARAGDLTLTGGRRRRRRYAVAIWATVLIFTVAVLLLAGI